MSSHTKEPWNGKRINLAVHYFESIGSEIAFTCKSDESMANSRRIVACVNACAGIRTEALEHRAHMLKAADDDIARLTAQRDELLAALQGMIDISNDSQGVVGYHPNGEVAEWDEFEEWQAACDAIANTKEGAE